MVIFQKLWREEHDGMGERRKKIYGQWKVFVDQNNRVTIPAEIRKSSGFNSAALLKEKDGYESINICIYPFNKEQRKAPKSSVIVSIDSRGRITIPKILRERYGFLKAGRVLNLDGVGSFLALWHG